MDPVTHVLAAATVAELAGAAGGAEGWALAAAAGASLAPDVDFLARRLGHLGLLRFHHTVTHSFVGVAALAALWAGVLSLVGGVPWLVLAAFAGLGVLTHVGLDLILHNNGVMLFWPFSRRLIRGGWFLGLNPLTSSARCGERKLGVCLVCQAHSVAFNRVTFIWLGTAAAAAALWPWRRWVCAAGVGVFAAYLIYKVVRRAGATRLARAALGEGAVVFPASFGARRWLAVAARDGGYATATVDAQAGTVAPPVDHAPAPAASVAATARLPSVGAFTENAIFPFAARPPDGAPGVWWQDLSYAFTPDVVLHTLKIGLDAKGDVAAEEFRERW